MSTQGYIKNKSLGQRGVALLYVIGAIAALGAIATAITTLTPSSTLTEIFSNTSSRAYYLAMSGQNAWKYLQQSSSPQSFTVSADKITLSHTFTSVYSPYTVTSVGTAQPGTASEANFLITKSFSAETPINDLSQFSVIENKDYSLTIFNPSSSIAPSGYDATTWAAEYAANSSTYGSAWLRIADNLFDSNGAAWYTGSRGLCPGGVCPTGSCINGKCGFGNGLRVVYSFKFNDLDSSSDSTAAADVMTFAIMTATTNSPMTAAGGPPDGSSLGEYMGYAGMGKYGVGIKPPKIGVEVDTFPNTGCGTTCSSNGICYSNTRCDNSIANHIAVVFWGDRNDVNYGDDNKHGAGGGSDGSPKNPQYDSRYKSGAGCGYYERSKGRSTYNWLEDGQDHTIRIEIIRSAALNKYEIKAWIADDSPGSTNTFMDVTKDYTGSSYALLLDYTVTLTSADDTALDQIYFGFTEGTGGSTQNADIHDFQFEFRQ
jgi:hypothetical protein